MKTRTTDKQMTPPRRGRVLLPAVVLAAALLSLGAPRAQQAIEERVDADADAIVEVNNLAGSVVVRGWSRNEVEVTGTLGRGAEGVEVRGGGRRVEVRVVLQERNGGDRDTRAKRNRRMEIEGTDLEIRVPAGCSLEVQTVSAEIEVSELDGDVRLQTVSGAVILRRQVRAASVQTVSASIDLQQVTGLQEADLKSVSGSLEVDGSALGGRRYRFETLSGDITVRRAGGVAADWDVETFSGEIDNAIGPAAERTSRYAPGQRLEFSTGRGARIFLKSFSGRVRLLD